MKKVLLVTSLKELLTVTASLSRHNNPSHRYPGRRDHKSIDQSTFTLQ